ncbi:MAG: LuxR C-terminal-related transcriptional regulator [Myxococcota bacterium]|nr:LuxR C-terminal-related transcriptional regulator [Myxococcota bacterium]
MDGRATLDVLRAAYRLDVDEAAWVGGLAQTLAPTLDRGLGVQTFLCDLRSEQPELRHTRLDGGTTAWSAVWRENWLEPHIASLSRDQLAQVLAFAPVSRAADLWEAVSRAEPTYCELLRRLAREGWSSALGPAVGEDARTDDKLFYPDSLNVVALDPSGVGVAIVANRPERARPGGSEGELERFAGAAAHLTAALRLRLRHDHSRSALERAEVVFDRKGRVVHAEGEGLASRDALSAAVSTRSSASPDLSSNEVLARWRTLHEGRWTLVDVEEADGKAWTLACPNAPRAARLEQLTQREREVVALLALGRSNKAIAYELGISSSTVATLVARARWKLGAKSAADLVRFGRSATFAAATETAEIPVAVGAPSEPNGGLRSRRRSGERPRVSR